MDDILMKSVIDKMEIQENRIAEIETTLKNFPGNNAGIEEVRKVLEALKEIIENISFPIYEMRELTKSVTELRRDLRQPVQNTIEHRHYYPKILWLTIVFFLGLVIVSAGWYMTINTIEDYKANDTKYRYLKVFGNNSLKELLFAADSLHRVDPHMRDSVIQRENDNRERFEMLQEANSKEKEAKELRKKAKGR